MEFGRRIAIEKDLERNEAIFYSNLVYDESGIFLIYSTLMGIKSLCLTLSQLPFTHT
jgi:peptidylprolyl isomerase domain and WD repeat-containing protein 1